jgi:hypothetical protein
VIAPWNGQRICGGVGRCAATHERIFRTRPRSALNTRSLSKYSKPWDWFRAHYWCMQSSRRYAQNRDLELGFPLQEKDVRLISWRRQPIRHGILSHLFSLCPRACYVPRRSVEIQVESIVSWVGTLYWQPRVDFTYRQQPLVGWFPLS